MLSSYRNRPVNTVRQRLRVSSHSDPQNHWWNSAATKRKKGVHMLFQLQAILTYNNLLCESFKQRYWGCLTSDSIPIRPGSPSDNKASVTEYVPTSSHRNKPLLHLMAFITRKWWHWHKFKAHTTSSTAKHILWPITESIYPTVTISKCAAQILSTHFFISQADNTMLERLST